MCVRPEAVLARDGLADRDYAAPLREARSELPVVVEPPPQAVEALRDRLARRERKRLRAYVDFDSGKDPLRLEQLRERRPVGGRLANGLVEEDHAADVVLRALGREKQVAVGAPAFLRRLGADRVEPLLDRAVALVGGEDPLAVGDDGDCRLFEL